MGVCSAWTRKKIIVPAKEYKRCNRDEGEIAVVEGFGRACRKSADNALKVTYKGISNSEMTAAQELDFKISVTENVVESNEGKVKVDDIVGIKLADSSVGRRRAQKSVVASIAFSLETEVDELVYNESTDIDLDGDALLQFVNRETVQTTDTFTPPPTREPTSAPTRPPVEGDMSSTTTRLATTAGLATVESVASRTAISSITLLGLTVLWW